MPGQLLKAAMLSVFLATGVSVPSLSAAPGEWAVQWSRGQSSGQPTARHESAAAVVDGKLYVIGGRGDRPLDILDLASGQWRTGAKAPLEINHVQAVVWGGRIYVIGAFTGPFPQEKIVPQVLIYDPASDRWTQGPGLPAGRHRGGAGVVVQGDHIYLVGGNRLGHNSGFVPWLDRFDPKTGAWIALADAPRPRDHFHAVVLDGKIYTAGGRRSAADQKQPLALTIPEMDIYDIASGRWTTAKAPLPTPRAGVSVVTLGKRVVVMGGESSRQTLAHDEVEAFDPAKGAWTTLTGLPAGRHGMQAVRSGDDVHILAGSRNRGGGPELNDHWVMSGF
jgi:N-acetylneuraminic acid mutarotase